MASWIADDDKDASETPPEMAAVAESPLANPPVRATRPRPARSLTSRLRPTTMASCVWTSTAA